VLLRTRFPKRSAETLIRASKLEDMEGTMDLETNGLDSRAGKIWLGIAVGAALGIGIAAALDCAGSEGINSTTEARWQL